MTRPESKRRASVATEPPSPSLWEQMWPMTVFLFVLAVSFAVKRVLDGFGR